MMKIKYVIIVLMGLFSLQFGAQNFTISTLRMGDYHLKMTQEEFQTLSKINNLNSELDYDNLPTVDYYGETLELSYFYNKLDGEENFKIRTISTTSDKFKTKSGMGVGNTRKELILTYKDYPNFGVGMNWDVKKQEWSKTNGYFTLFDNDASTFIQFSLENNVVVEVQVTIDDYR